MRTQESNKVESSFQDAQKKTSCLNKEGRLNLVWAYEYLNVYPFVKYIFQVAEIQVCPPLVLLKFITHILQHNRSLKDL